MDSRAGGEVVTTCVYHMKATTNSENRLLSVPMQQSVFVVLDCMHLIAQKTVLSTVCALFSLGSPASILYV